MTGDNVNSQSTEQPDSHSGIASPEQTLEEKRFDGNFK